MTDMICTCSADGVRDVEARRMRIFRRMGLADMDDLATAIVLSLAFDFGVEECDIYADQWFGVWIGTSLLPNGRSIECDWPFDGLAALWEQMSEQFPAWVSTRTQSRSEAVIADRISAALLARYERAEQAYREHRAFAHKDDNDCPPCDDCSVLGMLRIHAHRALDEAWGSRDLEPAIEQSFR